MKINAQTRISSILKHSPLALDAIVKLSPQFNKLKNPLLRKVMAPRVSIEQAASMGGCRPEDFFQCLLPLGFEAEGSVSGSSIPGQQTADILPEWIEKAADISYLDVRPVLASGKDPLDLIMKAGKELGTGEVLCVINTFEPVPLIKLLEKKAFKSYVQLKSEIEVHTYFLAPGIQKPLAESKEAFMLSQAAFVSLKESFKDRVREIDVREMEMPRPMLTILENTEVLPATDALFVHHKKVPVYLLPELEERGLLYHCWQENENNVKLLIYHSK